MKTKSLFLLVVCYFLAVSHIKAQAYIPFVKDGKMWTEYWYAGDSPAHGIDMFVMHGDTTFNNKSYKKVYATTYYGNFIKYVYDDTTNKKVYYYDFTHQKDSLIYDFNLQVGDTFYSNIWGSVCSTIVTDRAFVNFAGTNRIKFLFHLLIGMKALVV